ncbi:hypothetical protein Sjap_011004 [Stephania japonica]|uniref:Uncharacterized protein n=1 Tax=Stephania japonica TaxID=461633 RepID=A0AAP0JCP9_9MAGN
MVWRWLWVRSLRGWDRLRTRRRELGFPKKPREQCAGSGIASDAVTSNSSWRSGQ